MKLIFFHFTSFLAWLGIFGFSCPGLLKNLEVLFCGKNGIFLFHNFRAGAAEAEIQNQSILEQLQEYTLAQEILKILKNI